MPNTAAEARRLDAQTLQERLSSHDAPRVLDVSTPAEFETAHIPGSYNVPLDTLREHRVELRRHPERQVRLLAKMPWNRTSGSPCDVDSLVQALLIAVPLG